MRLFVMFAMLASTAACGSDPVPSNTAEQRRPQPMAEADRGCAAGLVATLDRQSFQRRDDDRPFTRSQLDGLARSAAGKFKHVADDMCRKGLIDAARMAGFRTLLIQSGSGATESLFYEDQASFPRALVFQWTFVEEDLRLPDLTDITDGLTCWADPAASICADRMP